MSWTPFWESYKCAIHDNTELTDIEKFNYLRSFLVGTALGSISGLSLTAPNYKEAILVLEKTFGNKQRIIAKHMDALMELTAVTSPNNLKGLRHLYDTVELHTRSLNSLGVASDSYGNLLASVLIKKLPHELQLIISRKIGDDEWKLGKIKEAILEELQARERTIPITSSPVVPKRAPKEPITGATLFAGGSNKHISCSYCRQPHSSNSCPIVTEPHARRQALQKAGCCFVCLRRGHLARECTSNIRCPKCGGRHHISICSVSSKAVEPTQDQQSHKEPPTTQPKSLSTTPTDKNKPVTNISRLNPTAPAFKDATKTSSLWVSSGNTVMLQTAQALSYNPKHPQLSQKIRIVFDSGSQHSYVTERVKDDLVLAEEGEQTMTIMTFGSEDGQIHTCKKVTITIALKNGLEKQLSLLAIPSICQPLSYQPILLCQEKYEHLTGLDLADSSDGGSSLQIDVLIGCDLYWELVTGKVQRGRSGPTAIETHLGWVLSGPIDSPSRESSSSLVTHTLRIDSFMSKEAQVLDERLKEFWDLESFGITDTNTTVLEDFKSNVQLVNGRYEVSLPWKFPCVDLQDNFQLCHKRLKGLLHRLHKNEEILTEYDTIIRNQIQQGIVEYVDTKNPSSNTVHYLPHHPVIRHDKDTTKVRVVYDASVRSEGPSLNDCLFTGPKFDQNIFDLILKFRLHKVPLLADIEKAFLMVSMAEPDQDVLRFLWVDDITTSSPEVIELRFARVIFGVSASPFLLNATIQHHLKNSAADPTLISKLSSSFYVDDLVTGADNEEAAYHLYLTAKDTMKAGGFNLRKFTTSSPILQSWIQDNELSEGPTRPASVTEADSTFVEFNLSPDQNVQKGEKKVLGICWDIANDLHF